MISIAFRFVLLLEINRMPWPRLLWRTSKWKIIFTHPEERLSRQVGSPENEVCASRCLGNGVSDCAQNVSEEINDVGGDYRQRVRRQAGFDW